MSFRYEVSVSGKWYPNEVCFETHQEADRAGNNKFFNWTMCDGYRVVEDTRPANYRWIDDGAIHIATEA